MKKLVVPSELNRAFTQDDLEQNFKIIKEAVDGIAFDYVQLRSVLETLRKQMDANATSHITFHQRIQEIEMALASIREQISLLSDHHPELDADMKQVGERLGEVNKFAESVRSALHETKVDEEALHDRLESIDTTLKSLAEGVGVIFERYGVKTKKS